MHAFDLLKQTAIFGVQFSTHFFRNVNNDFSRDMFPNCLGIYSVKLCQYSYYFIFILLLDRLKHVLVNILYGQVLFLCFNVQKLTETLSFLSIYIHNMFPNYSWGQIPQLCLKIEPWRRHATIVTNAKGSLKAGF